MARSRLSRMLRRLRGKKGPKTHTTIDGIKISHHDYIRGQNIPFPKKLPPFHLPKKKYYAPLGKGFYTKDKKWDLWGKG